ncbi:MAG: L-rhamnose mutarotase [Chloroflexota bacterium]
MARITFVMELNPGNEAIYRQKHDDIWPEMVETLHRFGIRNYSIFRHGLTLFAYLECDDPVRLAGQPDDPMVQRWGKMMRPYIRYNVDGTPWSEPIEETFHLD